MTIEEKVYVDQYGTEIRLDCDPPADDGKWYESDGETERTELDISGCSAYKILVKKPGGTEVTWTAARYLSTRFISYTIQAGDFDEIGKYRMQALLEWASPAASIPGETVTLKVYDRYK